MGRYIFSFFWFVVFNKLEACPPLPCYFYRKSATKRIDWRVTRCLTAIVGCFALVCVCFQVHQPNDYLYHICLERVVHYDVLRRKYAVPTTHTPGDPKRWVGSTDRAASTSDSCVWQIKWVLWTGGRPRSRYFLLSSTKGDCAHTVLMWESKRLCVRGLVERRMHTRHKLVCFLSNFSKSGSRDFSHFYDAVCVNR
jgi:hypothetical protein